MGKRFKDNGDGTVTDAEEGLMWKQTDGFQDESIFHTWIKAEDYVRELNNKRFAEPAQVAAAFLGGTLAELLGHFGKFGTVI